MERGWAGDPGVGRNGRDPLKRVWSGRHGFGRNGRGWGKWFGGTEWLTKGRVWSLGSWFDDNREDQTQVALWRRAGLERSINRSSELYSSKGVCHCREDISEG